MRMEYQTNGALVPGIHELSWDDFVEEFGFNEHRKHLIEGLRMALSDLQSVGCKRVLIDGSFVTRKTIPEDFDACWEEDGIDFEMMHELFPLFFDFDNKRANQKKHYRGELMPAEVLASIKPVMNYIDFFQLDRDDNPKGIISLRL